MASAITTTIIHCTKSKVLKSFSHNYFNQWNKGVLGAWITNKLKMPRSQLLLLKKRLGTEAISSKEMNRRAHDDLQHEMANSAVK